MKARIYHNPRCSKSRATLALLGERGVAVEVVDYLATPPTREALQQLLRKLGLPVSAIVRVDEPEFRAAFPDGRTPTDDELLDLLASQPRLLQRPIVEIAGRAAIGRPPERVLELLQ
jgi:arsenate reductase